MINETLDLDEGKVHLTMVTHTYLYSLNYMTLLGIHSNDLFIFYFYLYVVVVGVIQADRST